MARHSTLELTANVYARTRNEKPSELVEMIAEQVKSGAEYATGMHRK